MSAFLSTLSLRRATDDRIALIPHQQISIHALLAESDDMPARDSYMDGDFYPRSPCGERRQVLPRLPMTRKISIHALLAESDYEIVADNNEDHDFYPRSPCGERPPGINFIICDS